MEEIQKMDHLHDELHKKEEELKQTRQVNTAVLNSALKLRDWFPVFSNVLWINTWWIILHSAPDEDIVYARQRVADAWLRHSARPTVHKSHEEKGRFGWSWKVCQDRHSFRQQMFLQSNILSLWQNYPIDWKCF